MKGRYHYGWGRICSIPLFIYYIIIGNIMTQAKRVAYFMQKNIENKLVRLGFPDGSSLDGVIHGVADDGSLLVRTSAGLQSYNSGEITLYKME